ncbi:MAG: DUF4097 family beta strand repeat protein [Clostridia bacterium]|nr:DUF4097 family beta strand repeat protein [Clostridia bacterium]
MKPASIIFLVVALVVTSVGFFLCRRAEKQAEAEGIELFNSSTDEDGNNVSTLRYDTDAMQKISVTLNKGTVYLRRGTEQKVETYNMLDGFYLRGVSTNMLQINDTLGVVDMFKEGGLGLSFNGLRNILRSFDLIRKERAVVVYLPDGASLNSISVSVRTGDIVLEDFFTDADLTLKTEEGNVRLKNVSASGLLQISAGQGGVSLTDGFAGDLRIAAEKGDVSLENTLLKSAAVTVGEGNISLALSSPLVSYAAVLSAPDGITVNGTAAGVSLSTGVQSDLSVTAKTAAGRITVQG